MRAGRNRGIIRRDLSPSGRFHYNHIMQPDRTRRWHKSTQLRSQSRMARVIGEPAGRETDFRAADRLLHSQAVLSIPLQVRSDCNFVFIFALAFNAVCTYAYSCVKEMHFPRNMCCRIGDVRKATSIKRRQKFGNAPLSNFLSPPACFTWRFSRHFSL